MITDEEIAALSADERRNLIRRISRASANRSATRGHAVGPRELQVGVMVVSAVILIPWIGYLALALPHVYVTHNWNLAWVGFDVLLLMMIVATAVAGYLRRQVVMLTAFATGVLLVCDAWFDWMTSNRADVGWATLTALLVELPLALLLIVEACRLLRVVPARWGVGEGGSHFWDVRIPPATSADGAVRRRRVRVR